MGNSNSFWSLSSRGCGSRKLSSQRRPLCWWSQVSDKERCRGRDGPGWKAEPGGGAAGAGGWSEGTGCPRASVAATLATLSIPTSGLGTGGEVHPLDLATQACRGRGVEPLLLLAWPSRGHTIHRAGRLRGSRVEGISLAPLLLRDSSEAGLQMPSLWCRMCSD